MLFLHCINIVITVTGDINKEHMYALYTLNPAILYFTIYLLMWYWFTLMKETWPFAMLVSKCQRCSPMKNLIFQTYN